MDIGEIRKCVANKNIEYTLHAQKRMAERGIDFEDVIQCLMTGEIIKEYPNDKPFPSCLILGNDTLNIEIHVVVSSDGVRINVITAYRPDPSIFEEDLKTRR